MDPLQKIGDFFSSLSHGIERGITRMFGSSNERRVRQIGYLREKDGTSRIVPGSILDRINRLEPELQKLTDDELRQSSAKFRERLARGETVASIIPEAFAAVRESGRRYLRMRHYDVQMVGGYVLHQGMIAEMMTGEGKTLVATLPAYLNGLMGKVHVITVNDYLARRDMEWMAPIYLGLGLTVSAIHSGMDPNEKQEAYACDITYGTNNEFGFDYLRDNMKPSRDRQVQGPLDFALVDEIDNILIDEARTPLIISGPAHDEPEKYVQANAVALQLVAGVDFELKEKEHSCNLTDVGIRRAEQLAGVESFYTTGNMHWPHLIDNSLKAHHLYKRDVNYVVERGDVVIIDEHTGRKMVGRQWSDGLHQAVEAKEKVRIKEETQTLATITLQNYFKLYRKLAGMTGTAMTEADEFLKIYGLDVVGIPTNKPTRRTNFSDVIYRTEKEKWEAVVEEIRKTHDSGRPVLVGTVSIEKSELLGNLLQRYQIPHNLLNAKQHEREAEIIAQAGRTGAVTISTNMAGRGTDIILGGNPEYLAWHELSKSYHSRLDVPKTVWDETTSAIAKREGMIEEGRKVAELGGLHVVGTERHDSRRIDLQLRGRAGRQGDPGSSRFFVSLDDTLMRLFMGEWVKSLLTSLGMQEGEAIESPMVTRRLEAAQKKREEQHFDMRKHLLEYDEVMDHQRKRVYSYRQAILNGRSCRELVLEMIDRQSQQAMERFLNRDYRWQTICEWCLQELQVNLEVGRIRGMELDQLKEFLNEEAKSQADDEIRDKLEQDVPVDEPEEDWNWQSLTNWINRTFRLSHPVTERELKAISRDDLHVDLYRRVCDSIDKYDLAPLETFIQPAWGPATASAWLQRQFGMELDSTMLEGKELPAAIEFVKDQVRQHYRLKEVVFPVSVSIVGFLAQSDGQTPLNLEQLLQWSIRRFPQQIDADFIRSLKPDEIQHQMNAASERYLDTGNCIRDLDAWLDSAWEQPDPDQRRKPRLVAPERLPEIANWAQIAFGSKLTGEELGRGSREDARQKLLAAYDERYRPELMQAERAVILEVLDSSWKDHLYFMDRLKQGASLASYAQKDPKNEYRKEGMAAFNEMWDRIGMHVTGTIFRLEHESPQFVGSLWQISSMTHEEIPTTAEAVERPPVPQPPSPAAPRSGGKTSENAGQEVAAVAPIRNTGPRVGRNDPCPCGSGRKYKKCCGSEE